MKGFFSDISFHIFSLLYLIENIAEFYMLLMWKINQSQNHCQKLAPFLSSWQNAKIEDLLSLSLNIVPKNT